MHLSTLRIYRRPRPASPAAPASIAPTQTGTSDLKMWPALEEQPRIGEPEPQHDARSPFGQHVGQGMRDGAARPHHRQPPGRPRETPRHQPSSIA